MIEKLSPEARLCMSNHVARLVEQYGREVDGLVNEARAQAGRGALTKKQAESLKSGFEDGCRSMFLALASDPKAVLR